MARSRPSPSGHRWPDWRPAGWPTAGLALGLVALVSGCAGEPPEVTNGDPELIAGRAIYGASCASCHGMDGGGGVGSRLDGEALVVTYPEIEAQIELVTDGKSRMPAFVGRLDAEQLRAVVRYTREVL